MNNVKLSMSAAKTQRAKPLDGAVSHHRLCTAVLFTFVGLLTACSDPVPVEGISEPDPELFFVRGYRSAGDDCKLTGESAFTVDFLDDSADLVTCPTGSADAETLQSQTSARVATQTNSYTLYSVRRR